MLLRALVGETTFRVESFMTGSTSGSSLTKTVLSQIRRIGFSFRYAMYSPNIFR